MTKTMQHIESLTSTHEVNSNEVLSMGVNNALHILDQPHYWWAALVVILLIISAVNIAAGYSRHKYMK